MRRILVESARSKPRIKRGGGAERVDLDEAALSIEAPSEHVLAVDEALDDLATVDKQGAHVVKPHSFVGMTMDETATKSGVSPRSVYRNWSFARAWLFDRLGDALKCE